MPLEGAGVPYGDVDTYYWYPPANFPINFQTPTGGLMPGIRPDTVPETESAIPEGRVTIPEGAQVISADDKHVGNVEQVIADSETNTVTHFVVGKGFLLREHKLVPAHWITTVDEGKVYLSVESRLFDRLPDYQAQ